MKRGESAQLSPVILIVTSFMLILTIGLIAWGYWIPQQQKGLIMLSVLIGVVTIGCYLRAPVSYEIDANDSLIVKFRLGSRTFPKVRDCHRVASLSPLTIRLWANGGLFAIAGIFWNRTDGIFRGYITNAKKLVMVELHDGKKVVISPINPEEWNRTAG